MSTTPTIDRKELMVGELNAKAGLLLKNAMSPVMEEVARSYSREGLIAFCASLQMHLALEVHNAFGHGVAMSILKNVVSNVMEAEGDAERDAMTKSAATVLSDRSLQ